MVVHLNYNKKFLKDPSVLKEFIDKINFYLENKYKIILIYPIPNMKINVSDAIKEKIKKNKFEKDDFVYIEYRDYLKDTSHIFETFNNLDHKNLYKIFPHKIFCNREQKNRCVANNYKEIYYVDSAHLSNKGSNLVNFDLIKLINSIKN